ncbi:MAG: 23S rRNA (guanosine(2251)-2'-O)-methyltransferase RlmB [Rhodospirillaceae bacterium]|nr:23S rRNA (guanosine(2251)-2'-O)-methyltransferase RlmB [Rhodospirillaceae bacterium]
MPKRKSSHRPSSKRSAQRREQPRSSLVHPAKRQEQTGKTWLYGRHAIEAALQNPARRKFRLLIAGEAKIQLHEDGAGIAETVSRHELEAALPDGAVHQGMALQVAPLENADLGAVAAEAGEDALIILLDQASDPRNIGAVMRSAAAFGATAVVLPDRHAPEATGVLAKAASGALDRLPLVRVTNIARAIGQLKAAGFWCIGLDGGAETPLASGAMSGRIALIIGSEGQGLRRLTAEKCDLLAAIPIRPEAGSLNLSAAAAIALYELRRGS